MLMAWTFFPILAEKEVTFIKTLWSDWAKSIRPLSFLCKEIILCIKVYFNISKSMMFVTMEVLLDSIILIFISSRHLVLTAGSSGYWI